MKCMYKLGSSQRLPQTMCTWKRMRNFIIFKKNVWVSGLKSAGAIAYYSFSRSIIPALMVLIIEAYKGSCLIQNYP